MSASAVVRSCSLVGLLAFASGAGADHLGLDGREDFGALALRGFSEVVDGARGELVAHPAGSSSNSYPWSMSWHEGQLYVGTVRDVLCFLSGQATGDQDCDYGEAGELPFPGAEQRAEIWRYTPGGTWGLSGSWERVFQSPTVAFPVNLLVPADTPRDVGYRGMTVSDAGGVSRLYVATLGVPGRILYYNGATFVEASTSGLRAGAVDLASGEYDLGYRSMVSFRGRLWTSPVGTLTDTDISDNPVLLANSNPAGNGVWQEILHLQEDPAHGDPDHIGIFKMVVADGYFYISITNRVKGVQIWRTDGTGCMSPSGPCAPVWEKIVIDGGGRPEDGRSPVVDNSAGEFGAFGGFMYVGTSEAAAFDPNTAEMMRVRPDGKWELVAGWPRLDFAAIPNLHCETPLDLDGDAAADDCLPLSGRGPGMGSSPTRQGGANYFWQMQAHDGYLFAGTLGLLNGFSLWRTSDGVEWNEVVNDGFGSTLNYGVRTMASSEHGLFLGVANPFTNEPTGGLGVYLGTTAPDVPPVAEAGEDQLRFDAENSPAPGDGMVTVDLDGSDSNAPFGGHLAGVAWFEGDLSGDCAEIVAAPIAETAEVDDIPLATGAVFTDYLFTVRTMDDEGRVDCDVVSVRASADLAPVPSITTDPPLIPRSGDDRVRLVDFDGDGVESFRLMGACFDPEGLLVDCAWSVEEGLTLATPSALSTAATILALEEDGSTTLDARLVARDARGFEAELTIQVRLQTVPEDDPESNDRALCSHANVIAFQGVPSAIDPVDPGMRLCIDPDHADETLTYQIRENPSHGSATGGGGLSYQSDDDFTGRDLFEFRACDPVGRCSSTVAIGVTVVPDADHDGVGDAEDLCPDDPLNDADADGVCAGELFVAPKTAGLDGCPFDRLKTAPATCGCGVVEDTSDADGDGVIACWDNCPTVMNAGQDDSDEDGYGDACLFQMGLGSKTVAVGTTEVLLPLTIESGSQCIDHAELRVHFDASRVSFVEVASTLAGCTLESFVPVNGELDLVADCPAGTSGSAEIGTLRFGLTGLGNGDLLTFDCGGPSGERCADASSIAPGCIAAEVAVGCEAGDVAGTGDGEVDLLDLFAAHRALRDGALLEASVAPCADLAPGAISCGSLDEAQAWCPEGDGLVDAMDLTVIRGLVAGTLRASCDACLSVVPDPAPGELRRVGDVAPAGGADGLLDVTDIIRVLRFAVLLETATAEEALRADVAPSAGLAGPSTVVRGDGSVDVADVILLLRGAVMLEDLVWPTRRMAVEAESAASSLAFGVGATGWPVWAEAVGHEAAACTGVAGEGLDAAGDRWALTCISDPTVAQLDANSEIAAFLYRAPESVEPAALVVAGRVIDGGLALTDLPALTPVAK